MFGLDAQSIAQRAVAGLQPPHLPTLSESVLRGVIGFTLVSLGGFAPWVLAGGWFDRELGEIGLYLSCAVVFIGLSGPLLHRLIIGRGSLVRFYKLFSVAFLTYAVAWTVGWMALRGKAGSVAGLLAGTLAMGAILSVAFKAHGVILRIVILLFLTNAAGYFAGEWAYDSILAMKEGHALGLVLESSTRALLSKTACGLFYGLGFGTGIGFAFYACQSEARQLITALDKCLKAT